MKYYLSGPMTGIPEFNFPAFARAAEHLRSLGYDVLSAHEVDHGEHTGTGTAPWTEYLRAALRAMLDCSAIVLLPRWEESRGAKLELHVARALGYAVHCYCERRGLVEESWGSYRGVDPDHVVIECGAMLVEADGTHVCSLARGHLTHHASRDGAWWRRAR